MKEFLPLFLGCVLGLLTGPRPGATRLKIAIAVGIALGPLASWANGEIGEEPWMIVFDVAQVLVAFGIVIAVLRRLPAGRASRPRGG